jgi:catechol 2,3-dioxygenase-like lactoylglutathione lyase family enzyme
MSITGIAHICIRAKDLEKTKGFYCDVLGMEHVFNFIKQGEVKGFYLKAGDRNYIEVFENKDLENEQSRIAHLCLETDDIQRLKEQVDSHSIETTDIKTGSDSSYQFWVKDPDGINIEFHEYTDKSSQIIKKDAEMNW